MLSHCSSMRIGSFTSRRLTFRSLGGSSMNGQRRESVLIVAETWTKALVGFCQLYPTFCSVKAAPTYTLYDLFVSPKLAARALASR